MLPRSIPTHISQAIKNYDHALKLRWSCERGRFVLERKLPHHLRWFIDEPILRTHVKGQWLDKTLPDGADKKIRWKDGYVLILETDFADARLLKEIYEGDSFRLGTKAFIRKVDELERKRKLKLEALESEKTRIDLEKMWHYLKRSTEGNLAA